MLSSKLIFYHSLHLPYQPSGCFWCEHQGENFHILLITERKNNSRRMTTAAEPSLPPPPHHKHHQQQEQQTFSGLQAVAQTLACFAGKCEAQELRFRVRAVHGQWWSLVHHHIAGDAQVPEGATSDTHWTLSFQKGLRHTHTECLASRRGYVRHTLNA